MSNAPDIFLSYNREDQATAQHFAESFEAQGFSVWWDVTLRSGEAYDQVTEKALRSAKAVIVLWSKRSVESRWVRAEATVADRNRTLVPVRIEPCDLPVMFELTQTADLSHWQGAAEDKEWQAFLDDVRRMVGRGDPESAASHSFSTRSPAGSGIPAVAVVPFTHRGVEGTNFLADDLTEEITRELAQNYYFRVIAARTMAAWRGKPIDYQALGQQLDARYLAEARLQYSGENVRLTVQLVNTETASIVWSQRFGRKIADIEPSPEELQVAVAAELGEHIMAIERTRAMARPGQLSAWEHMMRCLEYMRHPGKEPMLSGIEEARMAVAAAPDFGLAHAVLATVLASRMARYAVIWGIEVHGEHVEVAPEIHERIKRAMVLDGGNPAVLTHVAFAYVCLGEGEAGLRLALRAVNKAPNSCDALAALGTNYFILGQSADAIAAFSKAQDLALLGVNRPFTLATLAICLFGEGRATEAEVAIDRSLALFPENWVALVWKAVIAAEQGKEAAAKAALRLLQAIVPGNSIDDYLRYTELAPEWYTRKTEATAILRRLLCEDGNGK